MRWRDCLESEGTLLLSILLAFRHPQEAVPARPVGEAPPSRAVDRGRLHPEQIGHGPSVHSLPSRAGWTTPSRARTARRRRLHMASADRTARGSQVSRIAHPARTALGVVNK